MVYCSVPVTTRTPAGAPVDRPAAGPLTFSVFTFPRMASTIARYPVHRHRFPFRCWGRSSSCASSKDDAVVTMPAVQNPHWNPAASTKLRCTGCRSSGVPNPATVTTVRPAARKAGKMQECTASPSISTEHAPQSPASQPFLTSKCPC
jgi:hypothetical protein